MAGKRSVAEVALRSTGGAQVQKTLDGVGKATERVGRQQTRLGQASASAGRQFSAQASGLGGLVAAYAGAAATIFAITAAFQALNAAARAEQTITGVNALANAVGESGPKILDSLQKITKGQLSLVQTAELANLALSSGFSTEQIENLAEISLKASRALGRDLTDSFNRLTRGVTKLEPELLDELGIFTRIEPAVEKYAAATGKVASQLSNFERRQAFANAVAEEGAEKFRDIDTTANTSSESLEKLSATVANIGQQVGAFIARFIAPLAEAISGNLVASVGAFGILAKFVFGTTLREASGAIENFNSTIESRSVAIIDKLGSSSRQLSLANKELAAGLSQVNLRVRAVSSANEQEFKTLVQLGRQNQLSQAQALRLKAILDQEKNSVDKLSLSLSKATMSKAQFEKATQRLENREKQLDLALASVNARLAATPKLAQAAATAFRLVATAVSTATSRLLGLFNAFTTIITVVSILTTVGAIILDAFGFLDPLVESVKRLIRQIEILFDITKDARGQRDAGSVLTEGLIGDPDAVILTQRSRAVGEVTGEDLQKGIIEAIRAGKTNTKEEFEKFIGDTLNLNSASRAKIADQLSGIFNRVEFVDAGTLQTISEFAEATGRTLKSVVGQTKISGDGAITFAKAQELGLDIITRTAAKSKDLSGLSVDQRKEAEKFNEVQNDILQSQEVAANLAEALVSGAATAEQIEKRRGAVLAKIGNLEKERAELTGDARSANIQLTSDLEQQLEVLNKSADAQLAILRTRDQIRKSFNAQIAAAGKVTEFFTIEGDSVRLTATAVEKRQAQVQLLQQSVNLGKEDLALRRAGVELEGLSAQRAQLASDAQKALTGEFLQAVDAAEKLADTLEKIVATNEKNTQQLQNQLLIAQIQAQEKDLARQEQAAKAQASRDVAALERARKRAKLEQDILKAGRDRRSMAVDRNLERGLITEEQGRVFKLSLAREALEALKTFTEEEKANLKEKARIETEVQQKILDDQRKLLGGDETRGLIDQRIDAERKLQNDKIAADQKLAEADLDNLKAQNELIQVQLKGFQNHTQAMAEILAADIVNRRELLAAEQGKDFATETRNRVLGAGLDQRTAVVDAFGGEEALNEALAAGFTNAQARMAEQAMSSATAGADVSSQLTGLVSRLSTMDFSKAESSIKAYFAAQQELSEFQLNEKGTAARAAAEQKLAAAQGEIAKIAEELGINLDQLDLELLKNVDSFEDFLKTVAQANHTMQQLKMGVRDALVDGLGGSIDLLFQNIADGKPVLEGMQEQLRGVFENVRKQVLQKTLIEPLQDKLTSGLNNMLGIGEKGADNAEVVAGALKVFIVNEQGSNLIKAGGEKVGETLKSLDQGVEGFGAKFGEVLDGVGNKFGDIFGGVIDSLQGIGGGGKPGGGIFGFLGGLFGGGPGMSASMPFTDAAGFGVGASGGFVPFSAYQRLAAGGQARDRVPALLEPGEFVMKRSSANSIGAPALNQMNATGKAGGNVVVNIQNQGTPQDATASEPRFDGEKFVIDIVTRDLRNNGPIRKSLRGGGAG